MESYHWKTALDVISTSPVLPLGMLITLHISPTSSLTMGGVMEYWISLMIPASVFRKMGSFASLMLVKVLRSSRFALRPSTESALSAQ